MRAAVLAVLVACGAPPPHKLPAPPLTPHLATRQAPNACGDDVAVNASGVPAIRYSYAYDAAGRLSRATGAYGAGGTDDTIDYTYDNLDHLARVLETRGWGDARVETAAAYDTLGDLVDYTWDETAPDHHDSLRYVYSSFTDAGQPTRETISQLGQPDVGYALDYDASNRIAHVVQDGGPTTTYTYDDEQTRTITVDTGNGGFHGVLVYDDQDHEQSESWDGTDPSAIAREDRYDWTGRRLLGVTYRSGSPAAPHALAIVEIDTLRYDCR